MPAVVKDSPRCWDSTALSALVVEADGVLSWKDPGSVGVDGRGVGSIWGREVKALVTSTKCHVSPGSGGTLWKFWKTI